MGDGEDVAEAQSAPSGRRILFGKIITEMCAARFRAQRREDGDGKGNKGGIGCRAVPLGQWEKIADCARQPFRLSYDAEMAGNDGPHGREVDCREVRCGESCDFSWLFPG